MLTQQYNYSVLFPWNPRSQQAWEAIANTTSSDVTIQMGTILGRIDATGLLTPMQSTATDGSQKPFGVLMQTTVIPALSTGTNVTVLIQGDVVANGLIFARTGDSLTTNITYTTSGDIIGTIGDILTAKGLLPIPSAENTFFDN